MCVWKHMTLPDTALADCCQCLEYCKKAQEQTLNNPLITAMYVHAEVRRYGACIQTVLRVFCPHGLNEQNRKKYTTSQHQKPTLNVFLRELPALPNFD